MIYHVNICCSFVRNILLVYFVFHTCHFLQVGGLLLPDRTRRPPVATAAQVRTDIETHCIYFVSRLCSKTQWDVGVYIVSEKSILYVGSIC